MRIHKGDTVLVIQGKNRGKTGKIIAVNPTNQTIKISGINVGKKHIKPRGSKAGGGITEIIMPLAVSKVMFMCTHCNKPVRLGHKISSTGTKERICKVCKSVV
ncbi:MAG: 50S ribosomal protein L24 [Patescibacteria group bacterium]